MYGFPFGYSGERCTHLGIEIMDEITKLEDSQPAPFFAMLDEEESASYEILAPLSPQVQSLLEASQAASPSDNPVEALKRVVRNSECLFLGVTGSRFVAKLSDDIIIKVTAFSQTNHYKALQHLERYAEGVPAPKPLGLIQLAPIVIMFTSYIPKITLTNIWPKLAYEQKISVQGQLEDILVKVRSIKRDGRPLGRIDEKGVIDQRGRSDEYCASKSINTVADFEDFLFSYRPWVSDTYVQFLRKLLPASRYEQNCVFTHCDVRPDNIMVDTNEYGGISVTGIVDWEEAGYYPAYWESVKSRRIFFANQDNDWYLFLPQCIAPSTYPESWLVDRLWESMIEALGKMDKYAKKSK